LLSRIHRYYKLKEKKKKRNNDLVNLPSHDIISRQKKEKIQEFVEEQLRKGYIRPSKSPQISPVFFVGKEYKKKRILQDY